MKFFCVCSKWHNPCIMLIFFYFELVIFPFLVKLFSYLAELIFNEVMTRSVSWLINSATRPFQLPFTIPPQAPSFTRLRAKSNERSLENLVRRSTQKPEQHLNIVEFEFLISSVRLTFTESKTLIHRSSKSKNRFKCEIFCTNSVYKLLIIDHECFPSSESATI